MNNPSLSNGPLNMRLQPALALAYIPSAGESLTQTANGTVYTASNWKTALVPSMGFEFAKGRQRLFTLSVFYTKPLAQKESTGTIGSVEKEVAVPLQSKTTTWGLTVGVPFSFAKAVYPAMRKERRSCERSHHGCAGSRLQ